MKLDKALKLAEWLEKQLTSYCVKICIAGSIRRQKPNVKDIEIVCQPIMKNKIEASLQGKKTEDVHDWFITKKNRNRILVIKNGVRYKQITLLRKDGSEIINADIFLVYPPAEWGVIKLIRTGSSDFSKGFVTKIKPDYRIKDGHLEKKPFGKQYRFVETPTEYSVFEAIGLNYLEPEARNHFDEAALFLDLDDGSDNDINEPYPGDNFEFDTPEEKEMLRDDYYR